MQKVKKLKVRESTVVSAIKEWAACHPEVQLFRFHTTGIPTRDGGMRPNENRGASDFFLQLYFHGVPILIFFECKGSSGRLTLNQEMFRDRVQNSGGYYFVVQGIQDAEDALEAVKREMRQKISTGFGGHGEAHKTTVNKKGKGNPKDDLLAGPEEGQLPSQMRKLGSGRTMGNVSQTLSAESPKC